MSIFDDAEAKIKDRLTKTLEDMTTKTKYTLDELTAHTTDALTKVTKEKINEVESNFNKLRMQITETEENIKIRINDLIISSATYTSTKRSELTTTINKIVNDESKKIESKRQEISNFINSIQKTVDDIKINVNKELENVISEFNRNFENYVDNNIDKILGLIINEKNVGKIIKAIVDALITKMFKRK